MLRLYNTLSRQEEEFAPSQDGTVRMYVCGPTVYARAHIGNFRTYVCVDVLRRALKHLCGYTMREAINYTDVDDKTMIGAFREDTEQLGIEVPEEMPRATDAANLRAMGDLVASLARNGHTYTRDGSTYFKISTQPDYGMLARLDPEGMKSGVTHHENEIAQSEAATSRPFSRFWFHIEHLFVENEKMSKSLGNVYTLPDVLARGYRASALRYLLLSSHYRKQLNFTWAGMEQAEESLRRIGDCLARLETVSSEDSSPAVQEAIDKARTAFAAALMDDLNTAAGLAAIFDLVRDVNAAIDAKTIGRDNADAARRTIDEFDCVLGVVTLRRAEDAQPPVPVDEIERLIEERKEARSRRDFAAADGIRTALAERGILLEDNPGGTRWKRK